MRITCYFTYWLATSSAYANNNVIIIIILNRTQFKAATLILMTILLLFVFVSLLYSVTNTSGTKIGIKINVADTTALQNFATVLNWVLLIDISCDIQRRRWLWWLNSQTFVVRNCFLLGAFQMGQRTSGAIRFACQQDRTYLLISKNRRTKKIKYWYRLIMMDEMLLESLIN